MKKIILLLLLACSTMIGFAQMVVPKSEYVQRYSTTLYGLYNQRNGTWALYPKYKMIKTIGTYEGKTYWAVVDTQTDRAGVVRSDNYNSLYVPCRYDRIWWEEGIFNSLPIVGIRTKNDCGLLGLAHENGDIILPIQYKDISLYPLGPWMAVTAWNGNRREYKWDAMVKLYNDKMKAIQERLAIEEKERQERLAREKKEKRLASFTLFAKEYVTPKVNAWQQKGEFEKLAAYQERVTGANREQKIREWTKEAEDLFIKENAELNPIAGLQLEAYDSENEVFSIRSPKLGQLLLPVPIAEAPDFKTNFSHGVYAQKPVYFINNDKIALSQLEFYNKALGKTYHYSNQLALNYQQYEIDPDKLDLAPVRITTSETSAPVAQMQKPTCEILSPAKGSTYSTPTIKLRYVVNVDPRTTPIVQFYVAGKEVHPIEAQPEKGKTSKGATVVRGTEAELPMPQNIGSEIPVSIQVHDGFGNYGEFKTITLKYVGEKPKPTLHLLAVGVSDYPASDLQNLSYAAKDARDFIQTISSSDLSMYKEMKPILITDAQATTKSLQRQLYQLTSRAAQGDVIMLFFSGHGVVKNDERYFMSYDASAEEYYNGLEFEFIRKRMHELSADKQCRVIVFMDACHSGAMAGMKGHVKDITFATPGIIGFYSSTAGEESAETDKLQNGVFTRVLLNGLKGAAKDKDGQVTLHTLDAYIKQNVSAQTKGKQTPIVENTTGDAVLFHVK
ncbi:MAG: caspase family protein [Paludibacteraceae bacterium]|nr:caspase family protein [Paludibacteraceae bacterium]